VLLGVARAPVRYVMRRRADFSHAAYLQRYLEGHARFGQRTPGILGYVQVHLDPALSERAARAAGLGVHAADSVSELQLASLEEFLRAVAGSSIAPRPAPTRGVGPRRTRTISAPRWRMSFVTATAPGRSSPEPRTGSASASHGASPNGA
jgi:hypothetical protein